MINLKKVMIAGLAVVALTATSLTAFAITGNGTPAEIVSNITGKSLEEVTEERFKSGKTYGELANDEGLWEDYKNEMLESKKAFLDEKVADGTLTQEEASEYYNNMVERQEYCSENGAGYGSMMGSGYGNGGMMGNGGRGLGLGQGRGCGRAWQ